MFYKLDGELLSAPFVEGNGYSLNDEVLETTELPIDGWYYFTSDSIARNFFNLPEPTELVGK